MKASCFGKRKMKLDVLNNGTTRTDTRQWQASGQECENLLDVWVVLYTSSLGLSSRR